MKSLIGVLAMLVAAAAVAVAAWIGYRATDHKAATVCFASEDVYIACVDPDDPAGTYRLTGIEWDGGVPKVVSWP
jgi:hypothetical protein